MRHSQATTPSIVAPARYLPPRNPIDSEMGIVDATTLTLLHKMMADSYEHGRIIWKENKARCAITGEVESDALPCGPNAAQKRVEEWLISAGLLDPDQDAHSLDGSDEADENIPPPSPSTPETRAWHRRLEIVSPRNRSPKSASEPPLPSPRSPLSPAKLWSAVQRGTSAIPLLTVRLRPKETPSQPSTPSTTPVRKRSRSLADAAGPSSSKSPSWDGSETLLATAFKRAAMLGTITDDDAEAIIRQHRDPNPPPQARPSWYIPAIEPPSASQKISVPPKPKPIPRPQYPEPASYRWPAPEVPRAPAPPPELLLAGGKDPCSQLRWYHPLLVLFFLHLIIISFSAYVLLRLILKPLVCLAALYYTYLLSDVLVSFL
ncbi:hypothetical protein DFH07DRAFT_765799 [Mycena maculata]|uniref:Uncharacterized protein n=1 Tax=Mycena maculata TaxID=230809 RepID=A0AAD7K8R8_9AGAR|nr:hypothetical protein DFH07DRAFT_765799 [Mycena maculata]